MEVPVQGEVPADKGSKEGAADPRNSVAGLIEAHEQDLARVAERLHDGPMQAVAALGIRIDMLLGTGRDEVVANAVEPLRDAVAEASARLHSLLSDLRGLGNPERPLREAIDDLVAAAKGGGELWVDLDAPDWREPSPAVAALLYRGAREALDNVARHAGAASATVTVVPLCDGYSLQVTDDGHGFDAVERVQMRRGGLGLAALQARLEATGGSLRVDSRLGAGTTVTVVVPDVA